MSIEDNLRSILFEIGKELKIHQLVDGNMIIEIDYEKYIAQILDVVNEGNSK